MQDRIIKGVAYYMAVSQEILNEFIDLVDNAEDDYELLNTIDELETKYNLEVADIDEMWDCIHFIITNKSAKQKNSNNPISQAIIGISVADTDAYISLIEPKDIAEINEALSKINIKELLIDGIIPLLEENNIYPYNWAKLELEEVKLMIISAFQDLKNFYSIAKKNNCGVIITIG